MKEGKRELNNVEKKNAQKGAELGQRRRGKMLKEEWKREQEDLLAHSSITLSSLD